MKTLDILSEDPMEMIWAVREKIYEETKNMTDEEFLAYQREASDWARRTTAELHLDDFAFPFLHVGMEK